MHFSRIHFWVQVHGLPVKLLVRRLGSLSGLKPIVKDFCFDYGRIGHERATCKFVSREAGRNSSYGPKLRTGIARNMGLSVEHYRKQVDILEARVKPLIHRMGSYCTPDSPTAAREGAHEGEVQGHATAPANVVYPQSDERATELVVGREEPNVHQEAMTSGMDKLPEAPRSGVLGPSNPFFSPCLKKIN
ncbi:hypothetical protein ACSBR2_029459 [Camellia fascicularis]